MQRGRGGRGNGGRGGATFGAGAANGGANSQAAQQLLWSLFAGAMGGQPRGRAGPRAGHAAAQPRPGEWACPCGFATNRPQRTACFSCGRERGGAAPTRGAGGGKGGGGRGAAGAMGKGHLATRSDGRGGGGGGPVGADGGRPLLGAHGATRSYSQVVAGTTWADRGGAAHVGVKGKGGAHGEPLGKGAAAAGGKGPQSGATAGSDGWPLGTPQAVMEEGGFQMVQPRKARAKGDGQPSLAHARGGQEPQHINVAAQRWSDLDSTCEEDEDMDQGGDEAGDAEWDGDAAGSERAAEEDPRQLRANYEELSRAVRNLEKRGGFDRGSTALRALEEARDKAERAWRCAKPPAPLATRMAWAEAKLRRAEAVVTRARLAVEELDAAYDKQRELLYERIHEAESWYRWRQKQCDDLHSEAADRAPARRYAQGSGGGTVVKEKIRDHLLPEVQAIMEYADGNPELLEKLSLLAAGLVDAEARLEGEANTSAAETYDIAEGDSDGGCWGGTAQDKGTKGGEAGCAHGKGGTGQGGPKGRTAEWRPDGPGRWSRAGASGKTGLATAETDAQAEAGAAAPQPKGTPGAGEAATEGHQRPIKGGNEHGRGQGDDAGADDGLEDGGPPRSRRRKSDEGASGEAREAEDRRRAQELHAQQSAAAAAQVESFNAGEGGFGSQAALSLAAQRFVGEVQNAQERAAKRGIEAKAADGRSLLELTPMELQEWVGKNLDGSAGC